MTQRGARCALAGAVVSSVLFVLAASHAQDSAGSVDAEPLLERAELRARLDELDAAEADFLEAIELITAADGEFAAALIRAYHGLAQVLAARGDYPEAVTVLGEARHVSHRNSGLFNLEQIELLDMLSEIYEQAGDTREAQRQQVEGLTIAQRHFGADDAGVVPYHFKLARYYELARMRGLAREQYHAALDIVRDDPDSTPDDELVPLTELVRIDTLTGATSRARRELEERLQSTLAAPAATRAEAYAVLGDTELADGDREQARDYYAQAYAAFSDPVAADTYFSAPRLINFVPPPSPVDWGRRRNAAYAWGSITASFGITADGKTERIRIVFADPPGLMETGYARRLAEAVFRPRLVAGLPLATSRLRFSHEFRHFVPDED